jgi:hypothetical protein
MRWRLLAALFLIVGVNQPVLARQDQTLVSQAETTTYQQDLNGVNREQNSKPDLRKRVGFSKKYERLLNRDPKEIIPDICTGC